jgi:serine phosphatase RsbU (regulator of sigma subunit)/CHASE2 domain-containing sensor protein
MLRLLLNPLVRLGLVLSLGILFVFLCFQYQWFGLLDLKIYDLGLSVRPQLESQSNVVIVAIDRYSRENSFEPPQFPISNHINEHSRVIERLAEAGARIIAFDVLFDQLDPQLNLTPFVSALGKAGNVILACVMQKESLKIKGESASIQEERMIFPSQKIPSSLYGVGLVNMPVGPDQVARQCYHGKEFQGEWYFSLPAAVVAAFLGEKAPDLKALEPFYIDYSSRLATIRYADVLKKTNWQNLVKGRIAMIGVTEDGLSDSYSSPVSGLAEASQGKRLPGVVILAYAAETLLRNSMIAELSRALSFFLCVLLVVGSSFLVLGKRLMLNLALMIVLTLVLLVCGTALVGLHFVILPTGKLIASTLFTMAVGILLNYSYIKLKSFEQETKLEEISSDLKLAREIQQKLQPEKIPVMEEVEVAGLQIPCKEIGGDYYDVILLEERKLALLIADVSGKGISGAMVMSNLQSAVRGLAPRVLSPSKLAGELNSVVSRVSTSGRFVTFFYGILDLATNRLSYCNAGHTYPVLCRADGETSELSEGGLFLGPFPQGIWQESEIQLQSGDLLFLYTDGVTEAAVPKTDEQYGEERLLAYLKANLAQKPETINEELVKTLQDFTGKKEFEDDFTVLTLKSL